MHGKESTKTTASSTLGGATSGDVHTGFGHPGEGQTSNELRHDGQHTRKNVGGHGGGLAGVGATVESSNQMADERTQPSQRAYEKEEGIYAGTRSTKREPQPDGEI